VPSHCNPTAALSNSSSHYGTEPSLRAILFGGEELFAESKKIILGEENNSGEEILRREQKKLSARVFLLSAK
jgi:chemotaxis receptor (MCP) glutamine deamidase CheD